MSVRVTIILNRDESDKREKQNENNPLLRNRELEDGADPLHRCTYRIGSLKPAS